VRLLERLEVWPGCGPDAAPLRGIRLVDDTGGLLPAPDVLFQAEEIGLDCFGYNVPNASLQAALRSRMALAPAIERLPLPADAVITAAPDRAAVSRNGVGLSAPLLIGADGRTSPVRAAAGIAAETWSYPQVAIATAFDHGRAHNDISTEFHRRSGPLTVVPMPGKSSSLVWVETPDEAERLLALDDDAFRRALEARLGGLLGAITAIGPRKGFPLSGLRANRMAGNRSALVGEAAHVFPPIGAQGLNLGLRDVAALYDCVAAAGAEGLGEPAMLEAYHRARDLDVRSRTFAVDALNRSLLTGFLPGQLLRGLGLTLAGGIGPLRRAMMRQGMSDLVGEPSLMRAG
jgi:2-octaprenyl-6-methoxyphenol hydroxylase